MAIFTRVSREVFHHPQGRERRQLLELPPCDRRCQASSNPSHPRAFEAVHGPVPTQWLHDFNARAVPRSTTPPRLDRSQKPGHNVWANWVFEELAAAQTSNSSLPPRGKLTNEQQECGKKTHALPSSLGSFGNPRAPNWLYFIIDHSLFDIRYSVVRQTGNTTQHSFSKRSIPSLTDKKQLNYGSR